MLTWAFSGPYTIILSDLHQKPREISRDAVTAPLMCVYTQNRRSDDYAYPLKD